MCIIAYLRDECYRDFLDGDINTNNHKCNSIDSHDVDERLGYIFLTDWLLFLSILFEEEFALLPLIVAETLHLAIV